MMNGNNFYVMANEWVAPSQEEPESLSGGSNSSSCSPHSSLQHIPAFNYYDSANLQRMSHYPLNRLTNYNLYKHRRQSTSNYDANNGRDRAMERSTYTNRSFVLHEPNHHQYVPKRKGGFMFESSHYGPDRVDRVPDRRRHSLHQLSASKMDDLKTRFDEYSSSAAVARGRGGGGGGIDGSRRPNRHQLTSGIQFVTGAGRLNLGYSGGRSLNINNESPSTHRAPVAEGRQKVSSAKTPKRGSRSSQGSTDSSHSSHSASSGSLLLTVANLENFAKINRKHESSYGTSKAMEEYLSSTTGIVPTAAIMEAVGDKYSSHNVLAKQNHNEQPGDCTESTDQSEINYLKDDDSGNPPTSSAIIAIEEITSDLRQQQDQQYRSMKTKDPDSVSVASSTHFTMINGVGGSQRLPKGGICSRGHQITVLIVTMSIVFMVGICAAVFFLEMRAREMPR
ncbi:uncharacterized protein LOC129722695 isoform X2 [Wyeomyia smithii]|uniref:uncharacterized protein LOC129722695 isoform X2 n=1 Tax=Wyeomyia smithii TaxID=174621 RepID=UPI0024681E3F|nr:uncharacterized protein LOC129722695 isoform X2 [Wyeomyia smithii]